MQQQMTDQQAPALQVRAMDYLHAFEARDLDRCLTFYDDAATLIFHTGRYCGRQEITAWHQDRFNADLRLLQIEDVATEAETVIIDATATSKRLKAWRIPSLAAKVEFVYQNDLIVLAKFGLRI